MRQLARWLELALCRWLGHRVGALADVDEAWLECSRCRSQWRTVMELWLYESRERAAWAKSKPLCRVLGHDWSRMVFSPNGVFWCDSAGPYDNKCNRCKIGWEETGRGAEAFERSQKRDPRVPGWKL